MDDKKTFTITIADGDYREAYVPLPKDAKEADEKIKRGMLARLGFKKEEIDRLVDEVDLEFDEGAEGEFDDGPYTPVKLVKKFELEPKEIPIPPPIPEPTPDEEKEEDPRQTMLQQYYGDRKAEAARQKTFERFKSHITQKTITTYDEEGHKKPIKIYTVEDYQGKAKDADELLITGYQTRLERLSRAHQGDFSLYRREYSRLRADAIKEIMEKYEEMHKINPEEAEKFKEMAMAEIVDFNDPEFEKKGIQALIDKDTEFIETNNYSYNSRQNTAENLKTLGKFGEKSVRAQVSKDQPFYQRAGLHAMNALIEIRNHTTAPVNKAIGTYIASPIFRLFHRVTQSKGKEPVNVDGFLITPMEEMLATSQKHSKGMYKNKPSHRYHARKDYFIQEESREAQSRLEEQARRRAEKKGQEYDPNSVKRTSLGTLIRLAIVPRIRSITSYKEGNTAILNAGLHDLEQQVDERNEQMSAKRGKIISTNKKIAWCEKEIEELIMLEKITKDPERKAEISKLLEQRETQRLVLTTKLAEVERSEIDSIQTDAVSMAQHDKANKANITGVVKGVKTAGRAAIGTFISRYIYREVAKRTVVPGRYKYIPGKTEEIKKEVIDHVTETVPGMDKVGIGNITLQDIYAKGSGKLSYAADRVGRQIDDKTSFFRGIKFDYDGQMFSGSDGRGFDPTVLTNVKVDQVIDGNTKLTSIIQEVLQDKSGKTFSIDQIEEMIAKGEISGIDLWRSTAQDGVPMGWLGATDIVPQLISGGSHTVTKEVKRTVIEKMTIPGRSVLIPGKEYIDYTKEINPAVVAAEAGLAAMEIADFNEIGRFTRSQESINMRQPKLIRMMRKENGQEAPTTDIKKKRTIKSFQRSNKSKKRRYVYLSGKMSEAKAEEWKGFTGSKRKDMKESGYDENAIGANTQEKPIRSTEEQEGDER